MVRVAYREAANERGPAVEGLDAALLLVVLYYLLVAIQKPKELDYAFEQFSAGTPGRTCHMRQERGSAIIETKYGNKHTH